MLMIYLLADRRKWWRVQEVNDSLDQRARWILLRFVDLEVGGVAGQGRGLKGGVCPCGIDWTRPLETESIPRTALREGRGGQKGSFPPLPPPALPSTQGRRQDSSTRQVTLYTSFLSLFPFPRCGFGRKQYYYWVKSRVIVNIPVNTLQVLFLSRKSQRILSTITWEFLRVP